MLLISSRRREFMPDDIDNLLDYAIAAHEAKDFALLFLYMNMCVYAMFKLLIIMFLFILVPLGQMKVLLLII